MKRKLPPYGREVIAALNQPDVLSKYSGNGQIWIAIGDDAWAWVNERRMLPIPYLAVVIPTGDDPDSFNWGFLGDAERDPIMLCAAGYAETSQVDATANALISDGVQRVLFLTNDGSCMQRYIAEGVSHAA